MKGVVSLLDKRLADHVGYIWDVLNRELGLNGVYATPYPHILFHSAREYDFSRLDPALRSFARHAPPFTVRTTGLGVLMEDPAKLYITVTRGFEINRFHQQLWEHISTAALHVDNTLFPELWIPGITLAENDLQQSMLPRIMWLLSGMDFNWEFTIDSLCYFDDMGGGDSRPFLDLDLTGEAPLFRPRVPVAR
ncbi:MAG: 2'-5' RNA ligase family protein [Blastocatellia bacterium]